MEWTNEILQKLADEELWKFTSMTQAQQERTARRCLDKSRMEQHGIILDEYKKSKS